MMRSLILVFLIIYGFAGQAGEKGPFELKYYPERPRNFIFPPLLSAILPGFDQYVEGQSPYGFLYTTTAVAGLGLSYSFKDYGGYSLDTQNDKARLNQLGEEFYKIGLGLSTYHSFRTAVRSRPNDFSFLIQEEKPSDLLFSAFNFSYFSRPTTYLGLPGILLAETLLSVLVNDKENSSKWHGLKGTDFLFALGLSSGAGISEEAVFRGWMMPASRYYLEKDWAANLLTAILFGAMHLSKDNPFPIYQALTGYYLGWVDIKNDWSIGEGIFIHTWLDVVIFLVGYGTSDKNKAKISFYIPIPVSF
jgi:membrane protease YdiL (CAAX protease family)